MLSAMISLFFTGGYPYAISLDECRGVLVSEARDEIPSSAEVEADWVTVTATGYRGDIFLFRATREHDYLLLHLPFDMDST